MVNTSLESKLDRISHLGYEPRKRNLKDTYKYIIGKDFRVPTIQPSYFIDNEAEASSTQ